MSLFAYAREQFQTAVKFFKSDLNALSDTQITDSPAGKARPVCDFAYEVICINDRVRSRMVGEDPGPWPFKDSWAICPAHLRSRDALIEELEASSARVINTFEKIGEKRAMEEIDAPGAKTTPLQQMMFMSMHTMYHDGQINYLQALQGDDKMNWPDEA
ncbi:MAG: DinB family protein [Armatimonadota bacterium]